MVWAVFTEYVASCQNICMSTMCVRVCSLTQSCLTLCNLMDSTRRPPGSSVHGIPQQEHLSRLPFPPLGNLLNPGIESMPLVPPELAGRIYLCTTWEAPQVKYLLLLSYWVRYDSLQPYVLQHTWLPCPSLSPGVCTNSCALSQ